MALKSPTTQQLVVARGSIGLGTLLDLADFLGRDMAQRSSLDCLDSIVELPDVPRANENHVALVTLQHGVIHPQWYVRFVLDIFSVLTI